MVDSGRSAIAWPWLSVPLAQRELEKTQFPESAVFVARPRASLDER
jgi:hypothetical protein